MLRLDKKIANKRQKVKVQSKLKEDSDNDDYGSDKSVSEDEDVLSEENAENSDEEANSSDDSDAKSAGEVSEDEPEQDEVKRHKNELEKLKTSDPEFYKFLKENDEKLLNFDVSDDNESDTEKDGDEETYHVPSGELEKASDESDFEDDEKEARDGRVITLKMLKQWRVDLASDKTNKTITNVVRAFHAALQTVSSDEKEEGYYKVEGSAVFNGVLTLCVLDLGPAMRKFLGITSGSQLAHKQKKFTKLKTLLRGYFYDLLKLLGSVTSSNILTVLLKHVHFMTSLLTSFPQVVKPILKKLISLWGKSEESVRVVAFLCILRITHKNQRVLLNDVLKWMHLEYVQNTKFVSVKTLPNINFMRRSLVELYSLDLTVAYEQMFLYTRQMAILVRNAIMTHTVENVQSVYNWQFVNNLRLWSNLLTSNANKPQIQPLIYPFVQLCFGTINLIPTTQFYPLRFHVVQILLELSKETGVFINVSPFILEVMDNYDINKAHLKVSMKPVNFTCILRASKSQITESGFKDTIMDMIYSQLLEFVTLHSTSLSFPELSLMIVVSIKKFITKCKKANFCSKMKQLVERIEQNAKTVEKYRKSLSANIKDSAQIDRVENELKEKGTPLLQFYTTWKQFQNAKKRKQATETEEISEHNLPTIKKSKKTKTSNNEESVTLFPSDSESDAELVVESVEKKGKRGKRGKKLNKKDHTNGTSNNEFKDIDGNDIVEELNADDW